MATAPRPGRFRRARARPELDAHIIDWDKFLPRFQAFRAQERRSREAHGLA
ncbi:MAG: hypothetical protein ACM3SU_10070 [Acidobacteriota bacterium]